jgi:hypothetical protein
MASLSAALQFPAQPHGKLQDPHLISFLAQIPRKEDEQVSRRQDKTSLPLSLWTPDSDKATRSHPERGLPVISAFKGRKSPDFCQLVPREALELGHQRQI